MAVKWVAEGELPSALDDQLAIVKADTLLPLAQVKTLIPSEFLYSDPASRWTRGFVGDTQHISIQTGLYPNAFHDREHFYAFVNNVAASVGPLSDLVVDEAVAWPLQRQQGCRCVVLKLQRSRDAQRLRDLIRANVSGFDRFGAEATFHVTVAYLKDPDDRVTSSLIRQLNALFQGAHVPAGRARPDDNGFQYYNSYKTIRDWIPS
jgi:hypothetical protein